MNVWIIHFRGNWSVFAVLVSYQVSGFATSLGLWYRQIAALQPAVIFFRVNGGQHTIGYDDIDPDTNFEPMGAL